jgi:hypothetical protein
VKDLVDLALLIGDDRPDRRRAGNGLHLTFAQKGDSHVAANLSALPEDWQTSFRALAAECGLYTDIATVFETVRKLLENAITDGIEQ